MSRKYKFYNNTTLHEMIDQRLDYLHNNPLEAGFVDEPEGYLYSSARDYAGNKGLIDIELLV
jgi:REP-associated tyrosine transposase